MDKNRNFTNDKEKNPATNEACTCTAVAEHMGISEVAEGLVKVDDLPPKNSLNFGVSTLGLEDEFFFFFVGGSKCIKGGSWGEVGWMSACCGFMFVVNLCSLPLLYFVRVFLGFFFA